MPIIVQTSSGRITGLWGSAMIRLRDGTLHPLKLGDQVNRGDWLLTSQDGLIELTLANEVKRLALPAETIPELITALNRSEPAVLTATALRAGDGDGLVPAERIERISETTSTRYPQASVGDPPAAPMERGVAPELLQPLRANSNAVVAVEEGPAVSLRLTTPTSASAITSLTVHDVPAIGVVQRADGVPLAVGMALAPDDLKGLVYLPPDEYDGRSAVGRFAYRIADALTEVTREVQIVVTPVNDAPVARSEQGSGDEDTTIPIELGGSDVDGSVTSFVLDSTPHGELWLHGANAPLAAGETITLAQVAQLQFRPDANFNGDVLITYRAIDDGGRASATARYALSVVPVNDAPQARPDALAGVEDTAATFSASALLGNDSDVEGDALRIVSVGAVSGGAVQLHADGSIGFTPTPEFNGNASFNYQVSDGASTSSATVAVRVAAVNDAPVALPDVLAAVEDVPIRFSAAQLLGNDTDVDGPALRIASVTSGTGGSAVLNADGSVSFTPVLNFNGPASFAYVASDGSAQSASTAVTVNVAPVNDAPVGAADVLAAVEDTPITFAAAALLGNDSDVEGSPLSIASVSSGTGGTATLNADGSVSFTPSPNFNGAASFSYVLSDGAASSAPVAAADALAATEDTTVTFSAAALLANDVDVDGDVLRIASVGAASGGTAVLNADGSVTFTPTPNFNGPAGFSYVATDGALTSTAAVTVNVAAVNDAPVANADVASTNLNQAITIAAATLLANDTDVDTGDALRIASVQPAVGGSVALDASGNVVFTPAVGFSGAASFSYTVVDGAGATASATVNVTVVANGPILVAPPALRNVVEGTASADSVSAILQTDLEQLLTLPANVLDTFNPPAGASFDLPFLVDVFGGGVSSQSVTLRGGSVVGFDWGFFNGETSAIEVQLGFNDMLLVVITDPSGAKRIEQITSSEQTGLNVNGTAIDATGTFQFTAPTAGEYRFDWLAVNGFDNRRDSSLTVSSPRTLIGAESFGLPVAFPVSVEKLDPTTNANLIVNITAVPAGAAFSAGSNLGGGAWSFTPAQLSGLDFLPPAGFTGQITLAVSASTVDPTSGAVLGTSGTTQSVIEISATTTTTIGTLAANTFVGTPENDRQQGYGGDDNLSGAAGNDLLYGDAGNDVLNGNDGADRLSGGADADTLDGGAGADRLSGGAGNDGLTGGTGNDVFAWSLADRAAPGTPAVDSVSDFETTPANAALDVLDLRDLLVGEAKAGLQPGNLEQFLDFDTTSSPGSTVIHISSTGGFAGGGFIAGAEDQRIVLQGVDLRSPVIYGLGSGAGDAAIIQQLLQRGTLVVDGP